MSKTKATLLPKVKVLYNFGFIKLFDFVYEKVEILKMSIFLVPPENWKSFIKCRKMVLMGCALVYIPKPYPKT